MSTGCLKTCLYSDLFDDMVATTDLINCTAVNIQYRLSAPHLVSYPMMRRPDGLPHLRSYTLNMTRQPIRNTVRVLRSYCCLVALILAQSPRKTCMSGETFEVTVLPEMGQQIFLIEGL